MFALRFFLRLTLLLTALVCSGCGFFLDLSPPTPDGGDGFDASTRDASADASTGTDGSTGEDGGSDRDAGFLETCGDGVVDPGEQCDDGNRVPGDGCEPSTCTYSCTEHDDCEDGDNCTIDSCNTESHTCAPPDVMSCPLPNRCSAPDGCAEDGTCLFALIDGDSDGYASRDLGACGSDCNDSDPDVHPGATEVCDMVDQDCDGAIDEGTGIRCGRDADGDGWGSRTALRVTCGSTCPAGYVLDMTDCWDAVGSWFPTPYDANPAQTMYFDRPRGDSGTYDWNCSGVEEPEETRSLSTCAFGAGGCSGEGWAGPTPGCGVVGTYGRCVLDVSGSSCMITAESRVQACR